MSFNPDIHQRRSIRLKQYDYRTAGAYFITLCIQNRQCLLGSIEQGQARLSAAGQMVKDVFEQMPAFYPGVQLDALVVMPNHIHAIIFLSEAVGATPRGCPGSGPAQSSTQTETAQVPEAGQARGPAPTLAPVQMRALAETVQAAALAETTLAAALAEMDLAGGNSE